VSEAGRGSAAAPRALGGVGGDLGAPHVSTTVRPLSPRRSRLVLAGVFALLLAALAAGIWGTVVRPAAYEVRGEIVARPAVNMILIRHESVPGLGMGAMELMAVFGDPTVLDTAGVRPGDRVRLAVRQEDDQLILLGIEKLR
jgi:Cu/Ag efflux protein CusF